MLCLPGLAVPVPPQHSTAVARIPAQHADRAGFMQSTSRLAWRANAAMDAAAAFPHNNNGSVPPQQPAETSASSPEEMKQSSWGGQVKRFFLGDKMDKQRLQALGLGAVASYGLISNLTYGTGLALSWIAFVQQFGRSPLMSGQWKPFLAFYSGFFVAQNFVRPLRFSAAVAAAPFFDRFIAWVEKRLGCNRRNAFGIYLILLGSVTSICVFGSIRIFAGPHAFSRGA